MMYVVIRTEYFEGTLIGFSAISVCRTSEEAINFIDRYANSMGETTNRNGVFTSKQGDSVIQLYYNAVQMYE